MKIRNILGLLGIVAVYVFIKFIAYQARHYKPGASSSANSNQFTQTPPLTPPATQPGQSSADATLAQICWNVPVFTQMPQHFSQSRRWMSPS